MTLRQMIEAVGRHPWLLLALFAALPAAAWLAGRLHRPSEGGAAPWRYGYAVLVYLACVPGIAAAVVAGYMLFFTGESLLDVNLLVFLAPPAAMAATLSLIARSVDFDEVPGFERLYGLMVMIAVSFVVALAVQKTRIWVFFGASFTGLLAFAAIAFLLLKWASGLVFGPPRR